MKGEGRLHRALIGEEIAHLWCLCVVASERCCEVVIGMAGTAGSSCGGLIPGKRTHVRAMLSHG